MEKVTLCAAALFTLSFALPECTAALREPFPQGCSMGNLGTIMSDRTPGCNGPMVSAAYTNSRYGSGVALWTVSLYDDMDDPEDARLVSICAGGWKTYGCLMVAMGLSSFNAFSLYREQSGLFSIGCGSIIGARAAIDLCGTRMYCAGQGASHLTFVHSGVSLVVPFRSVMLGASLLNVRLKSSGVEGADPPVSLRFMARTRPHTFGTQGILLEVTPRRYHPISAAIGQELRFSDIVAIYGAVSCNPLLVATGVSFFIRNCGLGAALVNHPVLGWSRGIGAHCGWN